jgi:hypothetical protein
MSKNKKAKFNNNSELSLTQLDLFGNPLESLINDNIRPCDNWINATKWCQHYNKDWYEFSRSKETKAFIRSLQKRLKQSQVNSGNGSKVTTGKIAVVNSINKGRAGSETWVHPLLAIKLAEWLSPDFDIYVKETFKRFLDNDITLADEIIQRSQSDDELKWIQARVEGKIARKSFTDELKKRGVTGVGYAMNTDAIYTGLFGKTAKQIKEERQIEHKDTTRDDMSFFELSAVRFAEANAVKRMEKHGSTGNKPTTIDSAITAQILKEAMDKILE